MSKIISQATTTATAKPQKYKAFSIYVDMSKVDRTWENYGYLKAPLAIQNKNGELSTRSHRQQVVILNDQFRKILSGSFALLPHEFISDTLNKHVLKNLGDLKLHVSNEYDAHDGDSHYWTLLSNKKYTVDGDKIQVGVSVRNGIGTNVSLGVDLYTEREVCTNGAVIRGKNLGSFSISHVGRIAILAKLVENSIRFAGEKIKDVINYYERSDTITVTDDIATKVYKKMPFAAKYMPRNWNLLSRYEIKDIKEAGKYTDDLKLVTVKGKQTLWDSFKEITEHQRDGLRTGRINFAAVSSHQVGLHNAMIQIVNEHGNRRSK